VAGTATKCPMSITFNPSSIPAIYSLSHDFFNQPSPSGEDSYFLD
jgi:hypothetical protein